MCMPVAAVWSGLGRMRLARLAAAHLILKDIVAMSSRSRVRAPQPHALTAAMAAHYLRLSAPPDSVCCVPQQWPATDSWACNEGTNATSLGAARSSKARAQGLGRTKKRCDLRCVRCVPTLPPCADPRSGCGSRPAYDRDRQPTAVTTECHVLVWACFPALEAGNTL